MESGERRDTREAQEDRKSADLLLTLACNEKLVEIEEREMKR